MCDYDSVLVYEWRVAAIYFAQGCGRDLKQAVAELGHTRITSCQLGQCSDQVEPDRLGMVLVIKRNFSKVYVKYL